MKARYLSTAILDVCFSDAKMCFVSGPRQCGKTTLAKMLLQSRGSGRYYNWDDTVFRRSWVKNPADLVSSKRLDNDAVVPVLVLDEIHKDSRWKGRLKGIYDTLTSPCDILVTGSARLDVYKRGSDSLLGRYYPLRLHPFSVREVHDVTPVDPDGLIDAIFSRQRKVGKRIEETFEQMMKFGPFPEPFLAQNTRKARLWRQTRTELIIREDLRDISRIPDLGRIELMISLLPDRVGSTLSLNSLRQQMEVSHDTIKRWLTYLKQLYYLYEVKPYHRSIPRSLKKEGKIYFWDYTEVPNMSSRFENLVGNHLLKACHYWTDTGHGRFDLFYLRNKEKHEIDFLVVREGKPWLPIEVKMTDTTPSSNWKKYLCFLPCKRAIQLVAQPHWQLHTHADQQVLVAGAAELLHYLP